MTNKEFFLSLANCNSQLAFDYMVLVISNLSRPRIINGNFSHIRAHLYHRILMRNVFDLDISVCRRKIVTHSISYSRIEDMQFYPNELVRWSPAVTLPVSNSGLWTKYLSVSLSLYKKEIWWLL